MASIMETLMDVLEQELKEYQALYALSRKKTQIIVANDVTALVSLTDEEQVLVDRIAVLDKKRDEAMKDVADVMNKKAESFKLSELVELLSARPSEQKRLAALTDGLRRVTTDMNLVNNQNRQLIESALEMVEFDLNLVRGMKAAPETAQYTSGAISAGNRLGVPSGRFDAKQ
ncbi:MAG: flagellar protein FlgN [Lachnospiraceae bacterium]|nr:flagellar protein FlgN [Lachnospiraceae bacterium]